MNILIVEARYHAHVADRLVNGATTALEQGAAAITRVSVPGVLELPYAVALAAHGPRPFDACVALGCVIGQDTIADTLYRETMRGLVNLSAAGIALGNGVLLALDEHTALSLADDADIGGDAARAALALATLRDRLVLR
jgi:6,7-dimethyl-8-ribityllumazine synthase